VYNNNHSNFVIYISENGNYTSFLVLTDDYSGNVLLLREEPLTISLPFNKYSSFYENSEIDIYLNSEYLVQLDGVQAYIPQTNIEITHESAIGLSGNSKTTITRKVFLLSCAELGVDTSVNASTEGKTLEYFQNSKNRIAKINGIATSWWLRTPNTYYLSCVYGIGADGKIGFGNAYDKNGIRPAFCLDRSMCIETRSDIIRGQSVYTITGPIIKI
jgi:hypothetical protein